MFKVEDDLNRALNTIFFPTIVLIQMEGQRVTFSTSVLPPRLLKMLPRNANLKTRKYTQAWWPCVFLRTNFGWGDKNITSPHPALDIPHPFARRGGNMPKTVIGRLSLKLIEAGFSPRSLPLCVCFLKYICIPVPPLPFWTSPSLSLPPSSTNTWDLPLISGLLTVAEISQCNIQLSLEILSALLKYPEALDPRRK